MSRSGTPTLPFVIPMYHYMQVELKKRAGDNLLLPSLRNAAAAGLAKLEEYYQHAKASQYTVLATGTLCLAPSPGGFCVPKFTLVFKCSTPPFASIGSGTSARTSFPMPGSYSSTSMPHMSSHPRLPPPSPLPHPPRRTAASSALYSHSSLITWPLRVLVLLPQVAHHPQSDQKSRDTSPVRAEEASTTRHSHGGRYALVSP